MSWRIGWCLPLVVVMLGCSTSTADPDAGAGDLSSSTAVDDGDTGEIVDPSGGSGGEGSAEPGGRELVLSYVTPDGWAYEGEIEFAAPEIVFEKDISESPPGRARLRIDIGPWSPGTEADFAVTNEGRTHVDHYVSLFQVGFPFDLDLDPQAYQFDYCSFPTEPGGWRGLFSCSGETTAVTEYSLDFDESEVDAMIDTLANVEPIYLITISDQFEGCSGIWIDASGSIVPPGRSPADPDGCAYQEFSLTVD